MITCAEVFEKMPAKFREFGLSNINGVFQFDIDGPEGGAWHAVCEGDRCRVARGRHANPDVVFFARDKDVVQLAEGRMNPALALATKRVTVKGNLFLASRLRSVLKGKI
jgi:putative sterol carrier protein